MSTSGTVEIHHSNVLQRINLIKQSLDSLKNADTKLNPIFPNVVTARKFKQISQIIEKVDLEYETDIIPSLVEYYGENKLGADSYNIQLASNDYNGKLVQCIEFIQSMRDYLLKKNTRKVVVAVLNSTIKEFKEFIITTEVKKMDCETCSCGGKMKVFPTNSERICERCGFVMVLYGTVFEDTQFYNQEGQRSKHGSYEPSRHCKFWVCRIQAEGSTEISATCIDQVTACAKRDGIIDRRKLMCAQIREYLKETKFTNYNDDVPLIRKIITGIVPPQLTHDELRCLYNLFDKCVNAYEKVKPIGKSNKMYYPYIIYKILDHIIKNSMRKRRILECIHLQSRDTLIANDNTWERICGIVENIDYKPTDKNDQKIYL
jgi:phage regulator Rha-like protein